ncbi:MAG: helix-turn-helix domain-containing protein, partial [Halodesulfurarchaeum sp.]
DIPEQQWTNPFPQEHPLHDLYDRRVRNEQDLAIIISDYHSRRGTGKTIASLQLGEGMDQSGGLTTGKATVRAEELRNAYFKQPIRSSLILDEGELGASNRDAMTTTNKELRKILSIGRVEQKYLIINTPDINFLDKDLIKLCDVWILMLRKGLGLVHFLEQNPYANSNNTLRPKKGLIEFKDIKRGTRLREVYNHLTKQKRGHIRGEEGESFIRQSEHEEVLRKTREEVRTETRNELLADIWAGLGSMDDDDIQKVKSWNGITQTQLAEAVGLSQQQISKIVS